MLNPIDPLLIKSVAELQRWSDSVRGLERRIALVPTMGALHEGHLSLVRVGYRHADRVIVSIFVNPTQFGPAEDFARYPRDLARDLELLRKVGADVVFAPPVEEIYPAGDSTWVDVDRLTAGLCGRSRPGHFRGVTTVVARLFNAARPHIAVFGEKDYQQLAVVRRMARDLAFGIEVIGGPIVREPDGLAMSSRNAFLSARARQQAPALHAALHEVRSLVRGGARDAAALCAAARQRIEKEPLAEIDYVELVCADTLEPLREVRFPAVMALAVRFEGTRLIDNTLLSEETA
ncbi:MAG TPA: pantoate--beta-alanine ligase [Myxococcota bacterium]|nr:pantoate--beta-alanine ligase [Myxococcota bacterium]